MLTIKENVLKYGPVECKLKSTRTPWDRAYSNMEDAAGPLWSYLSIEDFDNLCCVLHTEAPEELARFLNPQALINPDLGPDSGQPQISLVEYLRRVRITRGHLVKAGSLDSYGEDVVGGLISNPPPKLMTILSTHTDPNLKDLYKALLQEKKGHEEPEGVSVQNGVLTYTQNNTKVVVKLRSVVADFASTPSLAAPQLWKELCLEDMLCLIRGIDRAQASTTYRVFPELISHFGTVTDKRLQVHTASFPFPSERSGTVGLFEVAEMIGAARAGDRATYLYHFCQVSPALSAMLLHPTDEVVDVVKSLPTLQQLLLDARSANPYSFKGKTLSYHDTPILTLSEREFPTLGIKAKQACLAILRDTIVSSSDIEALFRACLVCRAPDPAFMLLEVVESICTTYSMELSLALPIYNWAEDQTKVILDAPSKFLAETLAGVRSEFTKLVDALAEKSGSAAVKRLQALILQARSGYVEDPSTADVGKWSIVEGRVQCSDEHFTAYFYNLGIEFSGTMSTPELADYLVNHSTPAPKDAFFDRTDYKLYSLRSHMQRLVDEERTVGELKRALIDDVATKRSAYEDSKSLKDLESWKLALRAKEAVQGVWKVENSTFSMRTTRGLESESTGAGGTEVLEWRQTAPLNMWAPNVQDYLKAIAKQVETVGLPLKTKDGLWAPQYDDPLEKEENWALTETYAERVSAGLRIRSSFKEPYAVVSTEALAKILLLKYSPTDNLGVVDDLEGSVRTLRAYVA